MESVTKKKNAKNDRKKENCPGQMSNYHLEDKVYHMKDYLFRCCRYLQNMF